MKNRIELLIVEDSPTVRDLLVTIASEDPNLVVVGQARDGAEAVRLTQRLKPDVISMDVNMPVMNGLDAVREIMRLEPTPVVIVSASMQSSELNIAFNAMRAGALAVVQKPPGPRHPDFEAMRDEMLTTLRLMADVAVIRHRPPLSSVSAPGQLPPPMFNGRPGRPAVLGLAASTGGPSALEAILGRLPADFPVPIVIVQHISGGFETGLADWLDRTCALSVGVASAGQQLEAGRALVAPSGAHLRVSRTRRVHLDQHQGLYQNMPSADVMFESLADVFKRQAMGVILTGMGSDGAVGLRAICDAGGITLAQNEDSSVVFGMPKEAIALGAAEHVVPLGKMAQVLIDLMSRGTA